MAAKILMIILVIMFFAVITAFAKTKNPLKSVLKSAGSGVCALLLVNLTAVSTGCYIAINHFTVFVATVLSLPGVIGLVLLNLVFI